MQTIEETNKAEIKRTATLSEVIHQGHLTFKLEIKTEKTYYIHKEIGYEQATIDCLLDMITVLKKQGYKIKDEINK